MRGVEASIHLGGVAISREFEKRICVMFNDPDIYIHGSREQLLEFARQIAAKVEEQSGK